jgi:DNA (cytosine-5)-methyltransferase 1
MPLTFGSLFAGIGGFDLGFERAGMVCKWQVEKDDYARRVLEKHWPNVPRWDDVRTFCTGYETWITGQGGVDVICAGFPCQPVSNNGKKKAQNDERWLWPEVARIVRILRPQWVVLENVPGLLERGIGSVLGDLSAIGYDSEWDTIPAASFGAPHLRGRVFVVSYPTSQRSQRQKPKSRIWGRGLLAQCHRWTAEPALARLGNGIPERVAGTIACGNAVVPQVAEWIGERIIAASSPLP